MNANFTNSTAIKFIVRMHDGSTLIEFNSGDRYSYYHVPEGIVKAFTLAKSAGKFFNQNQEFFQTYTKVN